MLELGGICGVYVGNISPDRTDIRHIDSKRVQFAGIDIVIDAWDPSPADANGHDTDGRAFSCMFPIFLNKGDTWIRCARLIASLSV